MTPILFALIALVGWGTADVFGGLVARKMGGYSSATWSYIICLVIATFYVPFALPELSRISLISILWLIILTPIGVVPLMSLYQGIKVGNASLVGTIAGSFGALVVILSVIFLGETINLYQVLSIITITVGLLLSSMDFKSLRGNRFLSDKGIPYALIALITWGIYFTFVKIPIRNIGWFWPAYFSWWSFPLALLFMKFKSIKFEIPKGRNQISWMLINGALATIAIMAYNLAVSKQQSSVVAPIASSYPALFAVIAYFVFKDRLSKQQIVGALIALLGIISLSILS